MRRLVSPRIGTCVATTMYLQVNAWPLTLIFNGFGKLFGFEWSKDGSSPDNILQGMRDISGDEIGPGFQIESRAD